MSIFRRDPEPAKPQVPAAPRLDPRPSPAAPPAIAERTHIASGSKLVGEISGNAELVIDGMVEGKIDLDSRVVIGAKGTVKGEIRARSVQIGGRVVGNVRGIEQVEIQESGRLEGDVVVPQQGLHIAKQAIFVGKVEMTSGEKATRPPGDKPGPAAPVPAAGPPGGKPGPAAPVPAAGPPGGKDQDAQARDSQSAKQGRSGR